MDGVQVWKKNPWIYLWMTLLSKDPAGFPTSSYPYGWYACLKHKYHGFTKNKSLRSDKGVDDTAIFFRNPRPSIPFQTQNPEKGMDSIEILYKNIPCTMGPMKVSKET